MSDTERKHLPPYMPYKTFLTFLDHLRSVGMPSHIDKSVMTSMSGAMQSWLKSTLKFMKLVDADDVPDERLVKLVQAEGEARKAHLLALFKSTYGFLDGTVDLQNTTPQKLRSTLADLGSQGETVEKMMAFLIAFAKDTGVPLSQHLTARAPRRARQTRPVRADNHTRDGEDGDESGEGDHGDKNPTAGAMVAMKKVELPNAGGTLTLSGSFNTFDLDGDERTLVFAIIDKMKEFERKDGS